ncbi:MAG: alpha/beta hydrolase [Tissierellia bacterium]|nr:alpha/beta hydrolase [Tissierellia bacterium]
MLHVKVIQSREKQMISVLERPVHEKDRRILVFFCHGFAGHKITPHRMAPNFSRRLSDIGVSMVRTDTIGSGDSEGDYHYMTIQGQLKDYQEAYQYWTCLEPWKKVFFLGYSMGGATATILSQLVYTDGMLLWSPVSNPYWNFHHFLGEEDFTAGMEGLDISQDGDSVSKDFFIGLEDYNLIPIMKDYQKPIRLIHGTGDTDVLPINAKTYQWFSKDCRVHWILGADHGFSKKEFQEELLEKSIEYIQVLASD